MKSFLFRLNANCEDRELVREFVRRDERNFWQCGFLSVHVILEEDESLRNSTEAHSTWFDSTVYIELSELAWGALRFYGVYVWVYFECFQYWELRLPCKSMARKEEYSLYYSSFFSGNHWMSCGYWQMWLKMNVQNFVQRSQVFNGGGKQINSSTIY